MFRPLFCLLCLLAATSVPAANLPKVAVSIAPIHSLVSAVTRGVVEPQLLIRAGATPHDYALRPSDARTLTQADVVIWVGEELEGVLARPLANLASGARRLTLMQAEGVRLLPNRTGGLWDAHAHAEIEEHGSRETDAHIWLSPENAAAVVDAVAEVLALEDPENADRYRANARSVRARISELAGTLQARLAPVREVPYLVFHDAYHYFEAAFDLRPVGTVAVDPDRRPGARRLAELREAVKAHEVRCVFSEPQFRADVVDVVAEGSGARQAELDPVGARLEPGPELWFALMNGLADDLLGCLAGE